MDNREQLRDILDRAGVVYQDSCSLGGATAIVVQVGAGPVNLGLEGAKVVLNFNPDGALESIKVE